MFLGLALWDCAGGHNDGDQASMDRALDAIALPAAEAPEAPPAPVPAPEALPDPEAPDAGNGATRSTSSLTPDGFTENLIETLDCALGGTVRVSLSRGRHPDPFKRKGQIYWTYDECGTWEYGTIDGTASYNREILNDTNWTRKLMYYARLEYSGTEAGKCDSSVNFTQEWADSSHRLELSSTCPHPVRQWWDRLGF
jgi:hypothetical protein